MIDTFTQKSTWSIFVLSILASISLVFFALYFYTERVVMYDSSFYLYYLIKDKTFPIQHHRFGSALTMLLPILATYIKLPFQWVAMLYSLNISLLWVFLAYIVGWKWKQPLVGLSIVLSPFIFNTEEYFWMVSEAQFLPAIWLTIYAFINRFLNKKLNLIALFGLFILLFLGITIHPTAIFCLAFLLLFLLINQEFRLSFFAPLIGVIALVFLTKFLFIKPSAYESSALGRIQNIIYLFPRYLDISPNHVLMNHVLGRFYALPLFLFLAVFLVYKSSKWHFAFFYGLAFFAAILFIHVCYYDLYEWNILYFENLYQPLAFALLLPVVLLETKYYKWIFYIGFVLLLFGVQRWWLASSVYSDRVAWQSAQLDYMVGEKGMIDKAKAPSEIANTIWCIPYESAVLSTLKSGKTKTLFVYENEAQRESGLINNDFVKIVFSQIKITQFNNQYMHLTDTLNPYEDLSD